MYKKVKIVLFVLLFIYDNLAIAQKDNTNATSLKGKMELVIDISKMTDTVGMFMVIAGGEAFYLEKQNNILKIDKQLDEPRRAFLAFYPAQTIKENPGKPLNEISATTANFIYFLAMPGKNEIHINNTVANSVIKNPSTHQQKYSELLKLKESVDRLTQEAEAPLITKIMAEQNTQVKDSLIAIYYSRYEEKYANVILQGFVKDNPDEPASLVELEEYRHRGDKNLKNLGILYNNLTERMKGLPTAKRIYNTIDAESFANNLMDKQAPLFEQKDPLGKLVALKDFIGNVTLIEFWASWCGACRASNPGLVKVYNAYKDKGLKILGVSLDKNKEHWIKAIKDDGLTWTQVSDLKFFENAAAELYHISGVPSNFLLDKEGKVVATNLDEKQLAAEVEKLLK